MPVVHYLLQPLTAFHYGVGRDDPADLDDLSRSDSLTSAILSKWSQVVPGADPAAITALAADPPFALSSAIPTIALEDRYEPLLFIPPGLIDSLTISNFVQNEQERDYNKPSTKALRKARFASIPALQALLQGKPPSTNSLLVKADGRLLNDELPSGNYADSSPRVNQDWEWSKHLWHRKKVARSRLVIDRETGHAAEGILFRYASTVFRPDLRLLILADLRASCDRASFEAAFRLLGLEGIGGGRAIGHGQFQIEKIVEGFDPQLGAHDAEIRMLLSLTHPTKSEVQAGLLRSPAQYELASRGGWAEVDGAGRFRRAAVPMLIEGSIVRNLGPARYGDSVCVLSGSDELGVPYDIYRSGCAVSIPISLRLPK